jgi:hypothetical protein
VFAHFIQLVRCSRTCRCKLRSLRCAARRTVDAAEVCCDFVAGVGDVCGKRANGVAHVTHEVWTPAAVHLPRTFESRQDALNGRAW